MATHGRPGPLPLVVAVTGHNDVRPHDQASLTQSVRDVLTSLRARYPRSPMLVVSPLAEGADRLVARVALDLGMRLIVPLPLEIADYKEDFKDAASCAEFDGLLSRAERSFVVPNAHAGTALRPHCYARMGAYIARHCHVLLALWNGRATHKIGGTAEIVRQRLEGMTPESVDSLNLLDVADTGLVYQIVTPRQSDPVVDGRPFVLQVLAPARYSSVEAANRALDHTCRSTDDFNALVVRTAGAGVARVTGADARLLPSYAANRLPVEWEAARQLHALADDAAMRFQRITQWVLRALFCIAIGLVASFELYAHGSELLPAMPDGVKLALYLAFLAAGSVTYVWAKRQGIDTKHLDYRALAEGLRVDFYWRVAQVAHVAADFSMHHRLEETEWIRLALRANELRSPAAARAELRVDGDAALRAVVDDWVKGQYEYYKRTTRRDHQQLRKFEFRTTLSFVLSAITGVAVLLSTFHLLTWNSVDDNPTAHAILVAVIGLSTAMAALFHGYAERRAFSAQIKRYERMRLLFGAALRLLEAPMANGDWRAAREVLGELGREALEENADWVAIHRERLIEMPT